MKENINLTGKIFIALILGIITGFLLYPLKNNIYVSKYLIDFSFTFLGNGFIRAIRMIVVPLVFCSLVVGSVEIESVAKLGRVGMKTLIFYLITTALAILLSLIGGSFVNFSNGLKFENINLSEIVVNQSRPILDILLDIIPVNPITALAEGNMLQVVVFAILLGTILSLLDEKVSTLKKLFEEGNIVSLKIVEVIMKITPYGIYGLIAKTFATLGYTALIPLLKYFIVVVIILILHCLVTYQGMLILFGKYNPIKFFKNFASTMMIAFSTASSSASLPSSLKTLQEKFGISKTISSFTIPLGSTINMDGTAIMQGVATIFIAQIYGINLALSDYITVILTATLASIGTAGVPGAGVIMLGMILTQIGLPLEGVAYVMGIDRFVDMFRTVVNITGDAICTLIVAKSEGEEI